MSPLAVTLVTLAGTPDDASIVDVHLATVARWAADTVAGVDYASITAWRGRGYTTVAASSDLARAVDQAQYPDHAGPCVRAAETGTPVAVPDVAATMSWPRFYQAAHDLGLQASLSVPLFAGSGAPIAVLNLYGRDAAAMVPLIAAVRRLYADQQLPDGLDTGGQQLLTGLAQALAVRATVQRAVGVLMARDELKADEAYLRLRVRAAEAGVSLADVAEALAE
jgi:hypothetical protein